MTRFSRRHGDSYPADQTPRGPRFSRRRLLQCGPPALLLPLLPAAPAAAYTVAEVARPARITGRVRHPKPKTVPAPPPVRYSGDCAYCRPFKLRREDLLVARDGGLRNVVVALEGVSRGKAPAAAEPTMAEHRCTFVPHVLSVTAGCKLLLHNRDPVLNTFHAVTLEGGRTLFNIGTPLEGQKVRRRIRRPGLIKMLCDVHPWEVAYVAAFAHPYHAVTDAAGRFALEGVPPGSYTLTLWHEKLGQRKERVTLEPGKTLELALSY